MRKLFRHIFIGTIGLLIIAAAIYIAEKYKRSEIYTAVPAVASVIVTWIVVNRSTEVSKIVQNYTVKKLKDKIMHKLIELPDTISLNDLYEYIPKKDRDIVTFLFAIDELKQGQLAYIVDGGINGKNEGENAQHGFGTRHIGEGKLSRKETSEVLSDELPKLNETLQDLTHAVDALNIHLSAVVDQHRDPQYVALKHKIKSILINYLLCKSEIPHRALYDEMLKYMENISLKNSSDFADYDFNSLLRETVFDLCRARITKLHRDRADNKVWIVLISVNALKSRGKHRPLS